MTLLNTRSVIRQSETPPARLIELSTDAAESPAAEHAPLAGLPRPDFISQPWRKIGELLRDKILGSRLMVPNLLALTTNMYTPKAL